MVARGGDDDRIERDVRSARCGDDDGVHDLHICFCGVVGYSRGAGKETARDDEKGDGEDAVVATLSLLLLANAVFMCGS